MKVVNSCKLTKNLGRSNFTHSIRPHMAAKFKGDPMDCKLNLQYNYNYEACITGKHEATKS